MFLIQTCFDSDPTKRNSFNYVFMYIPIGPSKKDLYKIIIGLLLIIYLVFLGMYKPKAETIGIIPSQYYCPSGSSFQQIHNDKWYYGCNATNTSTFKTTLTYDFGANFTAGYYDISGFIYSYRSLVNIYANVGGTSCFITNNTYTTGGVANPNPFYLNFYCFNAYIENPRQFNIDIEGTSSDTSGQVGVGKELTINPHFDKSITTNINNIQNNTQNISDNLNDSSIDNSSANNLTSNSAFQDNNGLDAIIKAPLNFIQSLTSSTCSSISLTIPYIDANVSLPCMSTIYNKALGQQLVNLIALVINGVVLYRYCLKILQIIKDAKNPNKDELEVLDL